jgi:hypothetical protein
LHFPLRGLICSQSIKDFMDLLSTTNSPGHGVHRRDWKEIAAGLASEGAIVIINAGAASVEAAIADIRLRCPQQS